MEGSLLSEATWSALDAADQALYHRDKSAFSKDQLAQSIQDNLEMCWKSGMPIADIRSALVTGLANFLKTFAEEVRKRKDERNRGGEKGQSQVSDAVRKETLSKQKQFINSIISTPVNEKESVAIKTTLNPNKKEFVPQNNSGDTVMGREISKNSERSDASLDLKETKQNANTTANSWGNLELLNQKSKSGWDTKENNAQSSVKSTVVQKKWGDIPATSKTLPSNNGWGAIESNAWRGENSKSDTNSWGDRSDNSKSDAGGWGDIPQARSIDPWGDHSDLGNVEGEATEKVSKKDWTQSQGAKEKRLERDASQDADSSQLEVTEKTPRKQSNFAKSWIQSQSTEEKRPDKEDASDVQSSQLSIQEAIALQKKQKLNTGLTTASSVRKDVETVSKEFDSFKGTVVSDSNLKKSESGLREEHHDSSKAKWTVLPESSHSEAQASKVDAEFWSRVDSGWGRRDNSNHSKKEVVSNPQKDDVQSLNDPAGRSDSNHKTQEIPKDRNEVIEPNDNKETAAFTLNPRSKGFEVQSSQETTEKKAEPRLNVASHDDGEATSSEGSRTNAKFGRSRYEKFIVEKASKPSPAVSLLKETKATENAPVDLVLKSATSEKSHSSISSIKEERSSNSPQKKQNTEQPELSNEEKLLENTLENMKDAVRTKSALKFIQACIPLLEKEAIPKERSRYILRFLPEFFAKTLENESFDFTASLLLTCLNDSSLPDLTLFAIKNLCTCKALYLKDHVISEIVKKDLFSKKRMFSQNLWIDVVDAFEVEFDPTFFLRQIKEYISMSDFLAASNLIIENKLHDSFNTNTILIPLMNEGKHSHVIHYLENCSLEQIREAINIAAFDLDNFGLATKIMKYFKLDCKSFTEIFEHLQERALRWTSGRDVLIEFLDDIIDVKEEKSVRFCLRILREEENWRDFATIARRFSLQTDQEFSEDYFAIDESTFPKENAQIQDASAFLTNHYPIVFVDSDDAFELAKKTLLSTDVRVIALDCENKMHFFPSNSKTIEIFSISCIKGTFIFDIMNKYDENISTWKPFFVTLFSSNEILKLGYDLSQDLEHMQTDIRCAHELKHHIDLYYILKDLKYKIKKIGTDFSDHGSLSFMCQYFLGKQLSKDSRMTNWSRRPLSEKQVKYAALDSEVLIHLFMKLKEVHPEIVDIHLSLIK